MSDFARIKKAIQEQKDKKLQAEAKIETLKAEKQRLLEEAENVLETKVSSLAELETVLADKKQTIVTTIEKIKELLDKEGVSY
jgi:uncharacterized protein HemX